LAGQSFSSLLPLYLALAELQNISAPTLRLVSPNCVASPRINIVTPPAELRALGVNDGNTTETETMVATNQMVPMRIISDQEQDTPNILRSHVSYLSLFMSIIQFNQTDTS
jgi:hypothetical protein